MNELMQIPDVLAIGRFLLAKRGYLVISTPLWAYERFSQPKHRTCNLWTIATNYEYEVQSQTDRRDWLKQTECIQLGFHDFCASPTKSPGRNHYWRIVPTAECFKAFEDGAEVTTQ